MTRLTQEQADIQIEQLIADIGRGIARIRRSADLLCERDGSPEARRRAKSLRIKASYEERRTRQALEWLQSYRERSADQVDLRP